MQNIIAPTFSIGASNFPNSKRTPVQNFRETLCFLSCNVSQNPFAKIIATDKSNYLQGVRKSQQRWTMNSPTARETLIPQPDFYQQERPPRSHCYSKYHETSKQN